MANLYVGNLAFGVTDDGLQELFVTRGFQITSARVIRDRDNGGSRGFGFVEVGTAEEATRAISELNGFSLEGRALQVSEARPQASRSGGGGRGGFGGGGGRSRDSRDSGGGRRRF